MTQATLDSKTTIEHAADSPERTRTGAIFRPNVDIVETAEELLLLADIPGAKSEDIDIDFENGTLTLRAKVASRQHESTQFLHREHLVGDYRRTFQVHESIDPAKIRADYEAGVLTVHLPKHEAARPRKIAVNAE